jgi:hypothetical protein
VRHSMKYLVFLSTNLAALNLCAPMQAVHVVAAC